VTQVGEVHPRNAGLRLGLLETGNEPVVPGFPFPPRLPLRVWSDLVPSRNQPAKWIRPLAMVENNTEATAIADVRPVHRIKLRSHKDLLWLPHLQGTGTQRGKPLILLVQAETAG
jgi:hypothetical protein